jgi:hypothetical protein
LPSELSPTDLLPHLLYRVEEQQARFATWRMSEGHEALAIFTTAEAATAYRAALPDDDWTIYQPPREKVLEILAACRGTGILYAALDPIGGRAKTLFDIPHVLNAAATEDAGPTR